MVQKMPLFFERFRRVLINEMPSSVRIFGALRWGLIYLHIVYSDEALDDLDLKPKNPKPDEDFF